MDSSVNLNASKMQQFQDTTPRKVNCVKSNCDKAAVSTNCLSMSNKVGKKIELNYLTELGLSSDLKNLDKLYLLYRWHLRVSHTPRNAEWPSPCSHLREVLLETDRRCQLQEWDRHKQFSHHLLALSPCWMDQYQQLFLAWSFHQMSVRRELNTSWKTLCFKQQVVLIFI